MKRYNFQRILLIFIAIGMLAFNLQTAKADITLSFPSKVFEPDPNTPFTDKVALTIESGYTDADQIIMISLVIEYDSVVIEPVNTDVKVKGDPWATGAIVVDLLGFGVPQAKVSKWYLGANTVTDFTPELSDAEAPKRLKIAIMNQDTEPETSFLKEPDGGFPADLLTIEFKSMSDNPAKHTPLLFIDSDNSFFSPLEGDDIPVNTTYGQGDVSLPVELSIFTAIWYPDGIEVIWEAKSQLENLGWNLYRSESKDGDFVKVNGRVIEGSGTTAISKSYKFIDKDTRKGWSYFYYLETVSFNGQTDKTNIIEVSLVNTSLSWGAIKRLVLHPRRSTSTLTVARPITIIKVYDRNGNFLRIQKRK